MTIRAYVKKADLLAAPEIDLLTLHQKRDVMVLPAVSGVQWVIVEDTPDESKQRGRESAFNEAIAAIAEERLEDPTGTDGDAGYTQAIEDCIRAVLALTKQVPLATIIVKD